MSPPSPLPPPPPSPSSSEPSPPPPSAPPPPPPAPPRPPHLPTGSPLSYVEFTFSSAVVDTAIASSGDGASPQHCNRTVLDQTVDVLAIVTDSHPHHIEAECATYAQLSTDRRRSLSEDSCDGQIMVRVACEPYVRLGSRANSCASIETALGSFVGVQREPGLSAHAFLMTPDCPSAIVVRQIALPPPPHLLPPSPSPPSPSSPPHSPDKAGEFQAPSGYAGEFRAEADAREDPHLHFANGGRADFRGRDGRIYSYFSAPGIAANIKTEDATFTLHDGKLTVEGSFITELHVVARVGGAKRKWANVSLWASQFNDFNYGWRIVNGSCGGRGFHLGVEGAKRCEELSVVVGYSHAKFNVRNWTIVGRGNPVFGRLRGPRHRLDVSFRAKAGSPARDLPHGIVGQSFSSPLPRVGKIDVYPTEGWIRTTAMAVRPLPSLGHISGRRLGLISGGCHASRRAQSTARRRRTRWRRVTRRGSPSRALTDRIYAVAIWPRRPLMHRRSRATAMRRCYRSERMRGGRRCCWGLGEGWGNTCRLLHTSMRV